VQEIEDGEFEVIEPNQPKAKTRFDERPQDPSGGCPEEFPQCRPQSPPIRDRIVVDLFSQETFQRFKSARSDQTRFQAT
jgi:hypothetical protein